MTGALPDDVADPAGFVLAACGVRQARLDRAVAGGLHVDVEPGIGYVAAECNPDHARAEVALWRAVVAAEACFGKEYQPVADAVVAAARAYLTGAKG